MIVKFLAYLLLIIFFVILQLSFVHILPAPFHNLNLVLSVLMLLVLISYKKALIAALFFGIILDIYSFNSFGLNSISLIATLILLNFLAENFLTNRSIFSLIVLGAAGTTFFQLSYLALNFIFFNFGLSLYTIKITSQFLADFMWQLGFNLIFLSVVFYIYNKSTRGFLKQATNRLLK